VTMEPWRSPAGSRVEREIVMGTRVRATEVSDVVFMSTSF
jgi:hypothetical protein